MSRDAITTPEMLEFAREAFRVDALNRAGLSDDADFQRLEHLADIATAAQKAANNNP